MPVKQQLVVIGRVDDALFQKCSEASTFLNTNYKTDYHVDMAYALPSLYELYRQILLDAHFLPTTTEGTSAALPAVLVLDRALYTILSLHDEESTAASTTAGSSMKGKSKNEVTKEVKKALDDYLVARKQLQQQDASITSSSSSDSLLGCRTGEAFVDHVIETTEFRLFEVPDSDPSSYLSLARLKHKEVLKERGNAFCWMVVKINDIPIGRIVFELFQKKAPRTCENFLRLCRGDLPPLTDEATKQKIDLTYRGSAFTRIVKGAWVQGGDIFPTQKNGTKLGYSMYGKSFPDESFEGTHASAGVLGMSNNGDHTNASSFYVTVAPCSWMDKCYVAFGRVVDGMSVVSQIHDVATNYNQSPKVKIEISECGETSLE